MDNGLIFPYPCTAVRAETSDAKPVINAFGRRDLAARSCGRQAGGETQEGSCTGRWSSRGKGVGRQTGKSVCHEPET
jgi:hypothetical protein